MAGLRERKKHATRQALGIAAMTLAVERGLDNVLVDDIAEAAGVSPRTFNNYFASKYEAICALAVDRSRRAGDALRARPADEPLWTALTAALAAEHRDDGPPTREWADGVRLVTGHPALQGEYLKAQALMRDALAEAIGERVGADPGDMFPAVLAGAAATATEIALDRWLAADPPTSVQHQVERALDELAEVWSRPLKETA
ncbi:TetR/AcrR family transcriptional regulator [Phytomonospora endophytica]|uniref:AcrR family transcriptional regulator n=1 Tax=Phytomonospora endophytica TaxID=714109 RepID=A0A841FKA3_9ACTN|nr:TetR/AcrR family transcriptional regulator [Phytomonospora endophytica]MBB6033069.1 AcrR family transcriptional regulator [Phytomonospora endophytica]GIG65296.1 TetR family transcriptional regulator [Phytomonospora endophytica]